MNRLYRAALKLLPLLLPLLMLAGLGIGLAARPPQAAAAQTSTPRLYIFRVMLREPADVARLTSGGWDVIEARGPDYLLVVGDDAVAADLRAQGFVVTIDRELDTSFTTEPLTYFGGYRTVAEHYQHLDDVAAAHPDLALVVDYGDSWRKVNGLPNGHDLKAICITKRRAGDCALNPETDKPRFFLMAAIHARELTTAELAWRWIDYLVDRYNVDPDVTVLLDNNELWVVPLANPDGRFIVEQGSSSPYLQRKNANNTSGVCNNPPSAANQYGVDLNRNANFQYGGTGTSTYPCDQTYRGTGAASEPEEYALEAFMQALFRDQRGPALTDAAPITTTGAMITLHSYSNLVLLPWGWTDCLFQCSGSQQAPNNLALRSFAFRMSYFNQYDTGQASELLYSASGTTDDWAYGVLGIPGFTFEIGSQFGACGGFTPSYSCQDSAFWPLHREAFLYAAKSARQPYVTTFGPSVVTVTLNATNTLPGVPMTLTAAVDDGLYGNNGVGRPASQAISQAEVYVDTPPWAGGIPVALSAYDGVYNSTKEIVAGQLPAIWTEGRHTLFVRGRDAAGNWGPITAQWLWVEGEPVLPEKIYLPFLSR